MIMEYIETEDDREQGYNLLNGIDYKYGSRFLLLVLVISGSIISILEIVYDTTILGLGYLGLFASLVAIWVLGFKRCIQLYSFRKKEEIIYTFDFNKDMVRIKSKEIFIENYYDFDEYFLIECARRFITLKKSNINVDMIDVLEKRMKYADR